MSSFPLPADWSVSEYGDPIEPSTELGDQSRGAASELVRQFGISNMGGQSGVFVPSLFGAGFFQGVEESVEPVIPLNDDNVFTDDKLDHEMNKVFGGVDPKGKPASFQDALIELQRQLRKGMVGLTGNTRLVNNPVEFMKSLRKVTNDMVSPVPMPRDIEAIYEKLSERMFGPEPDPERLTLADVDDAEMLTAIGYELGSMMRGGRMDGKAINEVMKRAEAFKAKREEVAKGNRQLGRMSAAQEYDLQGKLFNVEQNRQSNQEAMVNRLTEQGVASELNQEQQITNTALQYLAPKFLDPNYQLGFVKQAAAEMDKHLDALTKSLQKVGIDANQVLILGDIARTQIETAATVAPPELRAVLQALADRYETAVNETLKANIPQGGFTSEVLRRAQTNLRTVEAALKNKDLSAFERNQYEKTLALWNDIRRVTYQHADNMGALSLARERFSWDKYAEGEQIDIAKATLALNGMKFMNEAQARQAGAMLEQMSKYNEWYKSKVAERDSLVKQLQEYEKSNQAQTIDPEGKRRDFMMKQIGELDQAIKNIPLLPGMTGDPAKDKAEMAKWQKLAQILQSPESMTPEQKASLFYSDQNQAILDVMTGAGNDSLFFGATFKRFQEQMGSGMGMFGMGGQYAPPGMSSYGGMNFYGSPPPGGSLSGPIGNDSLMDDLFGFTPVKPGPPR